MATREFDAKHIHDRAIVALEGLEKKLEADWVESCRGWYEKYYLPYRHRRNNRWWVKLFKRPLEPVMSFEMYVEDRKTWEDDWGFSDWRNHKERPFQQDRADLRRIRNLAHENEKASKIVVLSDTDYRDIVYYEKFA